MKKLVSALFMCAIATTSYAQFGLSSGGSNLTTIGTGIPLYNVGIGLDDPIQRRLHIYKDCSLLPPDATLEDRTVGIRLDGDFNDISTGTYNIQWDQFLNSYGFNIYENNTRAYRFTIADETGYTGINTSLPQGRLDVNSGETGANDALFVRAHASIPNQGGIIHHQQGTYAWQEIAQQTGYSDNGILVYNYTNRTSLNEQITSNAIVFHSAGRIGINMAIPVYNLDVNGNGRMDDLDVCDKIRAHEIEVSAPSWCDYVFDKNYALRSLDELESFIAENHHLPEVPSEKEVTENGVNLAEMDATLLKKIEELTLYVIELKKENEKLSQKIESINK